MIKTIVECRVCGAQETITDGELPSPHWSEITRAMSLTDSTPSITGIVGHYCSIGCLRQKLEVVAQLLAEGKHDLSSDALTRRSALGPSI